MPNELWDLFDKNGNHQGVFNKSLGLAIPENLYHKTVEVIPTDMEGNMLLVRRALSKKLGGGKLEFPAGSVFAGESEEKAAARELMEETGLWPKKIFLLQKARIPGIIRYTFLAYIPDLMLQTVQIQPEEVMSYQFATVEKWKEIITTYDYNQHRLSGYNEKLFTVVEKLVNRYLDEATPQPKVQHKSLTPSTHLATKKPRHLDERCYEKEVIRPPEGESSIEQGDDGT